MNPSDIYIQNSSVQCCLFLIVFDLIILSMYVSIDNHDKRLDSLIMPARDHKGIV